MERIILRHYCAAFMLDFALTLSLTSVPFVVYDRLGGDERMSGTVGAVIALTYATACIGSSFYVTRIRHGIRLAAFGALVFGGCFFASTYATHPVVYTGLCMAGFCGLASAWPAMHAWLGAVTDVEQRARFMARFNIAWILGMATGSFLSGPLFDTHFRLPFAMTMALGIGVFSVLLRQPESPEEPATGAVPEYEDAAASRAVPPLYLYCSWFMCFVGWCLVGASRSVFPKRLDNLVNNGDLSLFGFAADGAFPLAPASTFSILAFALTGTSAAVFYIMGKTRRWHFRYAFPLATQAVAAVALYLLGVTHSLMVMVLCFAAVGVNNYATFFASLFYSVSDGDRKHARAAVNEGLVGSGNFAGAMIFGWIAGATTVSTPFVWAPLVLGFVIAGQWAMLTAARRRYGRTPRPTTSAS